MTCHGLTSGGYRSSLLHRAMRNQHQAQLPHYFSDQITAARRFHLRAIHQPVKALRVLSGGLERCRDDYDINRRGFPHPILEFVAAGAGQLVMNGERFELGPGTVFTYGRGLPHRITSDGRQPLVKYFIDRARERLAEHGLAPGRVVRVAEPDRVRMIFDDLIDFALGDRIAREVACTQDASVPVAENIAPGGAGGTPRRAGLCNVRALPGLY
jgi:hypothetical protein